MRTTLERVQGTLQRIGHRLRQALGAIGEKTDQRGQMRFGLVAKNFQQLGVQRIVIVLRRHGRGWLVRNRSWRLSRLRKHHGLPLGQGMRGCCKVIDVVTLALGLGREFIDEGRHQHNDIAHDLPHRVARLDAAIENPIEQVFDGPGQLADDQCTHHPPTALERVECTSHFTQGILVVTVGKPEWQLLANRLQNFCGFLDEDFQQILVDRLFVGRRRQEARRYILSRRVDGCDRSRHDLLEAEYWLDLDLQGFRLGIIWQAHFRKIEFGDLRIAPFAQVQLR